MELIKPFADDKDISAYFTEANRDIVNESGVIPGLNFGHNTISDDHEVDNNFNMLFGQLEWNSHQIALAEQIHGSHIEIVDKPGIFSSTDGLITTTPDLPIGIRVADCAAVFMTDPAKKVIGIFHAGWRGASENIVPKGIDLMIKSGASVQNVKVYLSPCILQSNFEVGEEVAALFPDQFVNYRDYEKPHVDLRGYIKNQCMTNGIKKLHINQSEECTVSNDRYFSYRRERERAGRMLAVMKING